MSRRAHTLVVEERENEYEFFPNVAYRVARIKLMAVVTSWLSPTSWAVKVGQVLAIIVVCAYAGAAAAQMSRVALGF